MRLNQVAVTVRSLAESSAFYGEVLGAPRMGGTTFKGKATEKVQALAGAHLDTAWHADDREFFQLELFEYVHPPSRPFAEHRQPWDIGYSRLALEVNDVARVHAELARRGTPGLTPIMTLAGKPHFAARDPNGVLLEFGSAGAPLPASRGARFAGVALTVPHLETAMRSFGELLECPLIARGGPDKGMLWDEPTSQKRVAVLDGGTVWLELSEYTTPTPAPWPADYRISDLGILNVAFGFRSAEAVRAAHRRLVEGGFVPNADLVSSAGQVILGYLNDPQGFSVELLMTAPWLDGVMGFRKGTWVDRTLAGIFKALA